jgi:hypothetical protein
MMRYLVLALCVLWLASCGAAGGQAPAGAVIVFKRSGGIAGVSEEWRIYADGQVASGEAASRPVVASRVASLVSEIERLGFFEMSAAYGRDSQCADCFQYEITVVSGGRTKTVTTVDAARDAPPELQQVIDEINALLATLPPR